MNAPRVLVSASLALLIFTFGCGNEAQTTFEPGDSTPLLAKDKGCTGDPETDHPSCKPDDPPPEPEPDGNTAELTIVTLSGAGVVVWTDGAQDVTVVGSTNWIHAYANDKNGTSAKPDYSLAHFTTRILMTPNQAAVNCELLRADESLRAVLYSKLDSAVDDVVFDFQVGGLGEDPIKPWLTYFLFRWKESDGSVWSARVGSAEFDQPNAQIVFNGLEEDVKNPSIVRKFTITGGTVIVSNGTKPPDKRPTLSCTHNNVIEVTLGPVG